MDRTTRILLASAMLAMAGCASRPPEVDLGCPVRELKFIEQYQASNLEAASETFIKLAVSCPEMLKGRLRVHVQYFVSEVRREPRLRETHYGILRSLFDTGWTAVDGVEPDPLWVDLAQRHLEHGDLAAAKRTAQKISQPNSLLQMRVDRRFDAIVNAEPARFDIDAAHERNVERLRASAAAAPRAMSQRVQLAFALMAAGRNFEGLSVANEAFPLGREAFDDFATQYPWLLTMQGWLLLEMRRVDEALASLQAAERFAVGSDAYANFAINLGMAQERSGRPDDALATLAKAEEVNERGSVLVHIGRSRACLQKGDLPCATEALAKAKEEREGAIDYYFGALLRAGQVDAARELLLERLRDPDRRGEALVEVQKYKQLPPLPAEVGERAQREKLLALPDVRKAILNVGRIESFSFSAP